MIKQFSKFDQKDREDRNVIEQYQFSRSDADFEKIIKHFEPLLMIYCMKSRRAKREQARDAVQDVMLWLYENIDRLDETDAIAQQLFRAASRALSHRRLITSRASISLFAHSSTRTHKPIRLSKTHFVTLE